MATLTNPVYYAGGSQQSNRYVGYWGDNRVVRYTLTTGSGERASHINVEIHHSNEIRWGNYDLRADMIGNRYMSHERINQEVTLYFKIIDASTDSGSFANAGYDQIGQASGKVYMYHYKGDAVEENMSFKAQINSDIDIVLLPNKTYNLWIYPGFKSVDYGSHETSTQGYFNWRDNGSTTYTVEATCNHSFAAATCTTPKTCTKCGLTEGSVLGHSPGAAATCTTAQTCNRCGAVLANALGHSYSSTVTAPTCTSQGYTTHTCTRCGHSYIDTYTAALGHSYKSVVTVPTCTTQGYTTHTCSRCGHSYTNDNIPALGHNYVGSVVTEPTYESEGVMKYTCSRCGNSYTTSIPKLSLDSVVYIDTCVSTIPNPGPFATADSWLPNQNATISLNGNNLKVVSNQTSSTPGAYTSLDGTIPAGDKVTLTYTIKGNVHVAAYLWNESAGTGVLSTDYKHLTEEFQTFTLTGTVNNIVDKLYFFMVSPTTSSWFEIKDIQLTCSTTTFKPYQVFIDNGSGWDLYMAYIDNGSGWDACG